MTDNLEKLHATLNELKQELQSLDTIDSETRQSLENVMQEIDSSLHQSNATEMEPHTMVERLREATQGFENSHPTLFGIVSKIIDGLGQIGI